VGRAHGFSSKVHYSAQRQEGKIPSQSIFEIPSLDIAAGAHLKHEK
jgi:phosphotransferase system HPr-like phosphotransfer protein